MSRSLTDERREKKKAAERLLYATDAAYRERKKANAARRRSEPDFNQKLRERYATDPEYRALWLARAQEKRTPESRQKNRDACKAWFDTKKQDPEWRARQSAKALAQRRLREYGLSAEALEALLHKQRGQCAICEKLFSALPRRELCVDHCHRSGAVRGLLCSTCNRSIGALGDTAASVQKALNYLRAAEGSC